MATFNPGEAKSSVPWAVAIGAVAILPAFFTPVPRFADFFYLPKVLLLLGLELSLGALLVLRQALGQRTSLKVHNPLAAPLLLYWVVLIASTLASVDPTRSLLGRPLRWEGLVTFLLYGGLILLLPLVSFAEPTTREAQLTSASARVLARVDQLLRWGAAVMALIVAYGVLQRYGLDPAPRDEIRSAIGWYTAAFSTLGNPNFFGAFTATYLLLTATRFLCSVPGERRGFWLVTAGFAYYGLLTSLSRGAWLAACTAMLLTAGFMAMRRWLPDWRRLIQLLAVVVVLTAVWRFADSAARPRLVAFERDVTQQSGSVASRFWIWKGTAQAALARPWLGWGLESLQDVFPRYESPGPTAIALKGYTIDRAHNDFLQVAVSSGVLGLAAYLWLLFTAARTAWRTLKQSKEGALQRSLVLSLAAAALAHLLALGMNISTIGESTPFWGFLGLIATIAMIAGADHTPVVHRT